jgi:hypothetical protein
MINGSTVRAHAGTQKIKHLGASSDQVLFYLTNDLIHVFEAEILKPSMLKNDFKLAFSNLLRHSGYAALNIAGLTIG